MVFFIGQLTVDLIRQYIQVFLNNHLCNRFQIFLLHDCAGRIVRERQYQQFCLVCNMFQQLFRCQTELIFRFQFNDHRFTACHNGTRFIRHITRLRDQDFLARIQHHTHSHIDGFTAAYSHQNLMSVIIVHMNSASEIIGDLLF